jgi:hypothetical protein
MELMPFIQLGHKGIQVQDCGINHGKYPSLGPNLYPDSKADRTTEKQTHHVDIKSEGLRDVLRSVLQDVKGICLRETKPSV